MYQAIQTKYLGPSDVRGARVKATAAAGSIILSWDHALNPDDNHKAAAREFAKRAGWDGAWVGGVTKDGCYCFVQSSEPDFTVAKRHAFAAKRTA